MAVKTPLIRSAQKPGKSIASTSASAWPASWLVAAGSKPADAGSKPVWPPSGEVGGAGGANGRAGAALAVRAAAGLVMTAVSGTPAVAPPASAMKRATVTVSWAICRCASGVCARKAGEESSIARTLSRTIRRVSSLGIAGADREDCSAGMVGTSDGSTVVGAAGAGLRRCGSG